MKFPLLILLCCTTWLFANPQPLAAQGDGAKKQRILVQEESKNLPSPGKRFALVVGVDEYQDRQIASLSGAANDAKSLANALIRNAGFPEENVILLATGEPVERQPTRGNILRWLSNLAGVIPKDGLLLVSFAGHGIERKDQAYLLPADAQTNGDIALVEETAVSVTRLRDRIKATGVRQVLVILDACRNNPAAGRGDAQNPLTQAYAKGFRFDVRNKEVEAFATLYSTDVGQTAYEYTEKKQGYFTYALVEGLTGKAANERGEVTLAGLVRYLQTEVPKRVKLNLGGEKEQKPFAIIEGYRAEELVVAIAPPTGAVTTSKPEAPPPLEVERVAPRGALIIIAKQPGVQLRLDGRLIGESKTAGEAFRIKNQPAGKVVTVSGKTGGKPEIIKRVEVRPNQETEVEIGYENPRNETVQENGLNGRRKKESSETVSVGEAPRISSKETPANDSVKEELQRFYNRFGDALRYKNIKLLNGLYTDDFISKDKNGREIKLPEYAARVVLTLTTIQSVTRGQTVIERIETLDGKRCAIGRYIFEGTLRGPDGKNHLFSFSGRERLTVVKNSQGWQCQYAETLEESLLLDGKPAN